jgi:hypothetical protein
MVFFPAAVSFQPKAGALNIYGITILEIFSFYCRFLLFGCGFIAP